MQDPELPTQGWALVCLSRGRRCRSHSNTRRDGRGSRAPTECMWASTNYPRATIITIGVRRNTERSQREHECLCAAGKPREQARFE